MNIYDYGTWYQISIYSGSIYPVYQEWHRTPVTIDKLKSMPLPELDTPGIADIYQDEVVRGCYSIELNHIERII